MGTHEEPEKAVDPFAEAKQLEDVFRRGGRMVTEGLHGSESELPIPKELALWNQMFQGAGVLAGMAGIGGGLHDLSKGNYVDGGIRLAQGGQTTAVNVAGLAGYGTQGLTHLGTGLDGASAINSFRKGDIPGGLRDTTSTALGVFLPQAVAPWKLGWAVGTGLDGGAAEDNLFGGNRKASEAAADTNLAVRANLEAMGESPVDSMLLGHGAGLGQSVLNTVDAAVNAVAVPPALRKLGRQLGGDGENPLSFSLADFIQPGAALTRRMGSLARQRPKGPSEYDQTQRIIGEMQALRTRLEAETPANGAPKSVFNQPGPFDGMYDHGK